MENAEEKLIQALSAVLLEDDVDGLDEELVSYVAGMLASKVAEDDTPDEETAQESIDEVLLPFLESVACSEELIIKAEKCVLKVLHDIRQQHEAVGGNSKKSTARKLQQGIVSFSSQGQSDVDKDTNAFLWGTDTGIKAMANDLIDAHQDKTSAKEKRKVRKADAEKTRKLLSSAKDHDADMDMNGGGLVRMNVRKLTNTTQGADKRRDVQVRNVTVSLDNGTVLLEAGELRFAYQRRYGLIGENGVGTYDTRRNAISWPS